MTFQDSDLGSKVPKAPAMAGSTVTLLDRHGARCQTRVYCEGRPFTQDSSTPTRYINEGILIWAFM